MSVQNYNYKNNLTWTSNNTKVTPQQLFLDATYSFKEMVQNIRVRYIKSKENGAFSNFSLNLDDNHDWVNEQRHRKFGRCYTIYPDKNSRILGIYYIKLEL